MTLTEWLSKNWVLAVGIFMGLTLLLAYAQQILVVQFQWLAIFIGAIIAFAAISNTKSIKKLKMLEAKEQAKPIMEEFTTGTRLEKLKGLYKVNHRGELDIPKDGAWRADYTGNQIVYIDPKSGEPFAWTDSAPNIRNPIETPPTQQFMLRPPKIKEKTERTVQPG